MISKCHELVYASYEIRLYASALSSTITPATVQRKLSSALCSTQRRAITSTAELLEAGRTKKLKIPVIAAAVTAAAAAATLTSLCM